MSVLLLGLGLLLVILSLYLQTQHSFEHVIVPLLDAFIPGELQAESGAVTFPATIEVTGLSYQQPEAGLSVHIDRLRLRFAVIPLVRERLVLFDEIVIGHGDIRLTETGRAGPTQPWLRWAVHRGRMDSTTVFIRAEGNEVTVTDLQMAVADIGPGSIGTVDLLGEVSVDRHTSTGRWAGRVVLTGSIQQDLTGGRFEWKAADEVMLREWPWGMGEAEVQAITLDQTIAGSYDVTHKTLQTEASTNVRQGENRLLDASFKLRRTGTEMDAGLKIHEVTDHALNLLSGGERSFRLRSSHASGYVDIHALGERYAIRSVFTGQQLQALFDRAATPALDIDVAQAGTFDSGSRTMTVDILDVRVADRRKVWLAGELKRPLTIKLDADSAEQEPISQENPSQANWSLTVNDISVADLRPWFDVIRWKGLESVRSGRVGGIITASGRTSGKAVDLSLRLRFSDLVMGSAEGGAHGPPVTFDHDARGTLTDFARLQLPSYVVTATEKGQSRGTLRVSGSINLKAPTTDLNVEASLALSDLPGEGLNPLLAHWTNTRIDRALLHGSAQIKMTGELLSWEINLRGRRVSLRLHGAPHATMPVDLVVTQAGHLDRRTRILRIDKAIVQELQRSGPVLTAVLDHPIHFALNGKGAGPVAGRPATPLATFGIEVHRLDIEQLRPRLEFLKIGTFDRMRTGVVDARLMIRWWGEAEPLSISGNLDVGNLTLNTHVARISRPVTLRNRIDATLRESSLVQVAEWNVRALAGTDTIAEGRISGSTNVREGVLDLALKFSANHLPALLARIGLREGRHLKAIAGGAVVAEGHVLSHGRNHPLTVQATIRSRNLRLQPLPGRFLTYTIAAQGNMEVNEARTAVELKPVTLTLRHGGKDAGTVMVWTHWPLTPSEPKGTARIVAKHLDCGPVTDLYGALQGRIPGPLPVSAEIAMAMDVKSGKMTLQGQETIGPIRSGRKDGGPVEATVRVEQDLNRQGDEIHVTKLTFTADRPQGQADQVTATGYLSLAKKRRVQFKGKVISLDAGWYMAMLTAQAEGDHISRDRGHPSAVRAGLLNLDAEVSIGSVSYGSLTIGPGRLTAKGTDEQMEVRLEPTGLAEGQVEAAIALKGQDAHPQIEWSGKGQGLNVQSILQAVEPGETARMTGVGSFRTSGSGVLKEGLTKRDLKGTGEFSITGGQFVRMPMFDFLAKETHVEELKRMGFTELRGELRLEQDLIHFDRLAATGPVSMLEGSAVVAPGGTVDGLIFVKIGPSLAKNVRISCMSALLVLPDGFAALPFAVRINGPAKNLTFRVDPAPWDQAKGTFSSLAGKMKGLVSGCLNVL